MDKFFRMNLSASRQHRISIGEQMHSIFKSRIGVERMDGSNKGVKAEH